MTGGGQRPSAPLTILVAALGGEGGGVLVSWIVDAARATGLVVQATSVPGVAQRTGSTSYYVEMSRAPLPSGSPQPVFALLPMPGRIDVAIASEHVEAARLMERGFISPARTTLITSTSRTYTTAEKMQMGDGRFGSERVAAAADQLARKVVAIDLEALARQHGTMISAAMFGALAGSGVLPLSRAACEAVIGKGSSTAASRRGFAAAFEAVTASAAVPTQARAEPSRELAARDPRLAGFPDSIADVAAHGLARVVDFQDPAYGDLYLERLRGLARVVGRTDDPVAAHALEEAARRLALWMAYEDIPRVADLKTRPARFAQIRADAEMQAGQILHVTDHMKPGADEIADMLPANFGRRLKAHAAAGRWLPFVGRDLHVRSTGVAGFLTLRALARMKALRRKSLRFGEEQAAIERWLATMTTVLPHSPDFAGALAELPRLLKGYGDTQARGRRSFEAIMSKIVAPALNSGESAAGGPLRKAIAAALADPEGATLERQLN